MADTDSDESNMMALLDLLSDTDEDEDDEERNDQTRRAIIVLGGILMARLKAAWRSSLSRSTRLNTPRVDWEEHMSTLRHRGEFANTYTMEEETFKKLVELLRDSITFEEVKAMNSAPNVEPIFPELVVAISLKIVAGGRSQDIRDWAGVSTSSIGRCRDRFFAAVLDCEQLSINFPTRLSTLDALAHGFATKSNPGGEPVFYRCVGCIDGTIIRIIEPRGEKNKTAYFSGHYHCMGLNVQAICDSNCRFIYFAVAAPGATPDINAMKEVELDEEIKKLPAGFYVLGDNAYPLSEQIIVPYWGSNRANPSCDIFNFYLSQLRIRIEMAFGLFNTKFRIFRKPLELSLEKCTDLIMVCARLHNFIINEQRPPDKASIEAYVDTDLDMTEQEQLMGYIPGEPPTADELEDEDLFPALENIQGVSHIREALLERVVAMGLQRPRRNLERREAEQNRDK